MHRFQELHQTILFGVKCEFFSTHLPPLDCNECMARICKRQTLHSEKIINIKKIVNYDPPPPQPHPPPGKTRMSVVQTNTEDPPTPNLQRMFWDRRQQSSHVCGCRHSPEQSAALVHQKSMALHTAAPPPPPPEGKGSEDTVYGSVGQRTAGRERCCQHE